MILLQQLIGKTDSSDNDQVRVQKKPRAVTKTQADSDSRCVQVKSAVRRSEKRLFEALAIKRETTLSDLIRDFLLEEVKRERLK